MNTIEQIRTEIVRLKSQLVRGACAAGIAMETNCKEEAYNEVLAFIDSLPAESCLSDCNFKEYLRGVFEANNGIENDPDLLVKLHASTLLELAQKELPDSPDFEAEWKWYVNSRKDDLRNNAVTMNVKEVAKHFAEWQKRQDDELLAIAHFDGVQSGKEAERKEMMKEAVEGSVCILPGGVAYVEEKDNDALKQYILDNFRAGDKVKLIILKDDE